MVLLRWKYVAGTLQVGLVSYPLSVPKGRDTKLFQFFVTKRSELIQLNGILFERIGVLAETVRVEPLANIAHVETLTRTRWGRQTSRLRWFGEPSLVLPEFCRNQSSPVMLSQELKELGALSLIRFLCPRAETPSSFSSSSLSVAS